MAIAAMSPSHQAAELPGPREAAYQAGRPSYSDVLRGKSNRNDKDERTNLLSQVHLELNSVSKRALNLVITGLPTDGAVSDRLQVEKLLTAEVALAPTIVSLKRLGPYTIGKVQPLLLTFATSQDADQVFSKAKLLRRSANNFVSEHIYINKDLTKAESLAAYLERQERRARAHDKARARPRTTQVQTTQPESAVVVVASDFNHSQDYIQQSPANSDTSIKHLH